MKIFLSSNVQIRFPIPFGKGPFSHNSRLKCTNSGFETVHMGNHFEYIIIIYTTRVLEHTHTHTHSRIYETLYSYILYYYFIMIYLHALVNNYLKIVLTLRFVPILQREDNILIIFMIYEKILCP